VAAIQDARERRKGFEPSIPSLGSSFGQSSHTSGWVPRRTCIGLLASQFRADGLSESINPRGHLLDDACVLASGDPGPLHLSGGVP